MSVAELPAVVSPFRGEGSRKVTDQPDLKPDKLFPHANKTPSTRSLQGSGAPTLPLNQNRRAGKLTQAGAGMWKGAQW